MNVTEWYYNNIAIKSGYFIEIGVYNGKTQNSTKVLENNGWDGLLVEPMPENIKKIKKNRKTKLIEGAVWKEDGTVTMIDIGIPGQTGIKDTHRNHEKAQRSIEVKSYKFDSLPVPTHIDYLQIDTEGSELEILSGIDTTKYTINYICIEDGLNNSTYHNFMTNMGYIKIYEKAQDKLYKRKSLKQ